MAKSDEARLREQRLAAKLRENLRRRKAGPRRDDADAAPTPPAPRPKDERS
jgi:hypothetical protein